MKQNSKHWLQWQGTKDTSNNCVVYPRAWSAAINSTAPNYLRERFKEIREDLAWAEAMERQNNNPNHGTDLNALRDEWVGWVERNPPSQQLTEAVEQVEFKWNEDYTLKTNP